VCCDVSALLDDKTEQGDDLFDELDDMLADLNAQLNIIIPGSDS